MTMDADAVINPAVVRKIDGTNSRIDLRLNTEKILRDLVQADNVLCFFLITVSNHKNLVLSPNDNICALDETDMSSVRAISDGLISMSLLSFCALSDSSYFSGDSLFPGGETG
jgi:hypothetical protein